MHNAQHCQRESNKPERRGQKSEECPQAEKSGIGNGSMALPQEMPLRGTSLQLHTYTQARARMHSLAWREREREKGTTKMQT
jgi:hypothetical protein